MLDRNFSWVLENQLAGIRGPVGQEDLQFLKDKGISVLVRLAEKDRAFVTVDQVNQAGLEDFHVPMADFSAPSAAQIDKITRFVKKRLSESKYVAVSCGAGKGRTGTILTCILISMGNNALEAIDIMRKANRVAFETDDQERAIFQFAKKKA